jgi:hypothetical protein
LAEAATDSALSNFKGQLAASTQAEGRAEAQSAGKLLVVAQMEEGMQMTRSPTGEMVCGFGG